MSNFNIDFTVAGAVPAIEAHENALDRTADAAAGAKTAITGVSVAAAETGKKLAGAGEDGEAAFRKVTAGAETVVNDIGKLNAIIGVMRDDTGAAGRAIEGTGRSMKEWASQYNAGLEREADILERIRGPMREYKADLDALDAMLHKGALTQSEYTAEMDRLIAKQGTMQGPKQQAPTAAAPTPQGTSVADYIGVAAYGGGLMALGQQMESLVKNWQDIEDVTIKATNAAQKFVDATHNVNVVMAEQLDLSDKIHATYDTTIKLYDKVREGSEGVALSHSEQLRMTQTLAEAVQLSNKPVESAAALMSKFSFAMQSGSIEARALKGIMREVPAIAEEWRQKFGMSDQALMDAVKHNKLSIQDLVMAINSGGEHIDARFAKIVRTNEMAVGEFKERWTLALEKDGPASVSEFADSFSAAFTKDMPTVTKSITAMLEAIDDTKAAAERADQAFTHWLIKDGIKHATQDMKALLDIVGDVANTTGRGLGLVADPWGSSDASKTGVAAQMRLYEGIKAPIHDAQLELKNLAADVKAGGINGEEARQKYDALMTTINDGRLPETIKIWEALHLPQEQFQRDMRAGSALLDAGRISLEQYRIEMQKLADTAGNGDLWRLLDQHQKPIKIDSQASESAVYQAQLAHQKLIDDKMDALDKQYGRPADNPEFDKHRGAYGQADEPDLAADAAAFAKRIENMAALGKATFALDEAERRHAQVMQAERGIVQQLIEPQKLYAAGLEAAGKLLGDQTISAEQYDRAVDKLRATYLSTSEAGKTFAGGLEASWLKAKQDADAFGATLATTLVGDVDKLNEALVTMANGGAVAWGQMVDAMIADLEKLILKQLEVAAINATITALTGGIPIPGAGQTIVNQGGDFSGALTGGGLVNPSGFAGPGAYPTPAAATRPAASSAPAPVYNLTVVATIDDAVVHAAMSTPAGDKVIAAANRRSPGVRPGR